MVDKTVYEVKKRISATNLMQLVDINGTKKNFQSDFVVTIDEPIRKVSICVINQNQLDNGELNFEETENGKYSRRVIYKKNEQLNHYIAIKKHHSDKSSENISCDLIIHLQELEPEVMEEDIMEYDESSLNQPMPPNHPMPPMPSPELNSIPNLNADMSDEYKNVLRQKLQKLSDDDEYVSYKLKEKYSPRVNEELQNNISNQNKSISNSNSNVYFIIGAICILLFGYLFYVKKIKK